MTIPDLAVCGDEKTHRKTKHHTKQKTRKTHIPTIIRTHDTQISQHTYTTLKMNQTTAKKERKKEGACRINIGSLNSSWLS